MRTRIIYSTPDNMLNVIHPTIEMFDENSSTRGLLKSRGIEFKSDEEILNWIIAKDVPEGIPYRRIDVDELPSFRDFRNAWMDDGKTIIHDMVKANNLKRDKLRELRLPLLQELDVEYMRAEEINDSDKKSIIVAKKTALRDVTNFQDFTDIKQLKDYMPDILK